MHIVRCVPPSTRPNSLCEHLIGAHLSAATGAAASALLLRTLRRAPLGKPLLARTRRAPQDNANHSSRSPLRRGPRWRPPPRPPSLSEHRAQAAPCCSRRRSAQGASARGRARAAHGQSDDRPAARTRAPPGPGRRHRPSARGGPRPEAARPDGAVRAGDARARGRLGRGRGASAGLAVARAQRRAAPAGLGRAGVVPPAAAGVRAAAPGRGAPMGAPGGPKPHSNVNPIPGVWSTTGGSNLHPNVDAEQSLYPHPP